MRRLSLIGSTGSIGRNTLDVAGRIPQNIKVVALASNSDFEGIVGQARRFHPLLVSLFNEESAARAEEMLVGTGITVLSGLDGILEAATLREADIVVSSAVGAAGIMPTFAAVSAGKVVALANKEALVAAGAAITMEAERHGARLLPVDSEHSAIFQVLLGQDRKGVRKLILTASGGPFFGKDSRFLDGVTPEMALDHPRWKMGPKVTVDSATMMNKGFEIIEASWLFGLNGESIDTLIHPQSVVHSMVEFVDGSTLAQMGITDMRIPISFALSYPDRMPLPFKSLDLAAVRNLEFFRPDAQQFPCLKLAYDALTAGGGVPAAMNAANEVAVESFLDGKLPFRKIQVVVRKVMDQTPPADESKLTEILHCDRWARKAARSIIRELKFKP
ncbi:MAG: 1-deoxy-D-xylulose-5-phosphate reductoisomerase [Deltaproteobacteria bacterium]|nr:1-deoxy-D-xylulose-5-phosphate reductoisomerase [Deltaproteobacteria bacterium]